MTGLRILHCMRAPVGGLFRHVLDLAGAQAARGHDVGILADSNSGDVLTASRFAALAPELTLGITQIPMSRLPGLGDVSAARSTAALARRLAPDVLHGHGAKGGVYARLAARMVFTGRARPLTFYTPHGGSLHYRPGTAAGTAVAAAEKVLARLTDGLIFESDYARRLYLERFGDLGRPVRVIHNGLKAADFEIALPVADAADFVFVGELRALKGVDVLLAALARINAARPDEQPVTAVIVGAGPDAGTFQNEASRLGLAAEVRFPGALPAREAFSLGRALVVPSRAESLPYVVLEAAAAQLPVIATSVGGIPEIVAGTDTGLVPAGDPVALAAAMTAVLDQPNAAAARAARLRDRVSAVFSADAMASAVLAFYAEARGR